MKAVITGGAGFIGANLCAHLLRSGLVDAVTVVDDLSTGRRSNLEGLDVDLRVGSVLDAGLLDSVMADTDAVVHLAALGSVPRSVADPVASFVANCTGTFEVLEAVRRNGLPHTIVAGSSSVYGATPDLPKHERLPTRPMSPYAATKVAAEAFSLAYAHSYGMPVLLFRFFNVFGPIQPADHAYAAAIPRFIDAALDHRPLTVHGDGQQTRDFTFVDTVCGAIDAALRRGVTSLEPVNLAFGAPVSILGVIDRIARQLDHEVRVEHTSPRTGDVRHSHSDTTLLRELLPGLMSVPLDVALGRTIEWHRAVRQELSG